MSDADSAGARIEEAKMTNQDFAELLAYLRAESSQYPKNILQIKGSEAAALVAEIEALRAEVERLNRLLGRIVEGDGDSTLTIRAGTDALETDLWRCTVCGQVGTVGRCCGEETREPFRPLR